MEHDELVKRINELSRKQKTSGLTDTEVREQQTLRRQYIDAFKSSLQGHLENIRFHDETDEQAEERKRKGRK